MKQLSVMLAVMMAPAALAQSAREVLSEQRFVRMVRTQGIGMKDEEQKRAGQGFSSAVTEQGFQPVGNAQYNFKKSGEQQMIVFQPVLSPYEDWKVGVDQRLPVGFKGSAEIFGTKYSFQDNSLRDATQSSVRVRGELDIWKNIFGRIDRAELTVAEQSRLRAELAHQVGVKRQSYDLRKLYWSWVAATQNIELSKTLIETAERQLKDAQRRAREGAADRGEVARYQSQLDSRKSSSLLFQYEAELLLKALDQQIENFKPDQWRIDVSELEESSLPEIRQCLAEVSAQKEINLSHTIYDEMITALEKETAAEVRVAQAHSDADLALVGEYQVSGVDNSFTDARRELERERRDGYAVGVKLSVPLGGAANRAKRELVSSKRASLDAMRVRWAQDIRASHETMLKAIQLLSQGLQSQKANSENLEISYKQMLLKFRQGRVAVSQLVMEQDALFQSRQAEISLRQKIAHQLLDYLSVFHEFPCQWNKI